ncbi:MAG: hypothetical protein JXQ87_16830 [Bacteroidia bacterium]
MNKTLKYQYAGSIQHLVKLIDAFEDPETESLGNYEFILRAKTSIGVVLSAGVPVFDSFKVYGQIESISESIQLISLKRKLRPEFFISILISFLLLFAALFKDIGLTPTILFLFLGLTFPVIVQLLLRSQENAVIHRFVGQLGLIKR